MKNKFTLIAITILLLAVAASAQNRIKLFDPVAISASDMNVLASYSPWGAYKSASVYLYCPSGGRTMSSITGPDGGGFVADNALTLNGENVCRGNCFTLTSEPGAHLGEPMETAYGSIGPISVNQQIRDSGLYTFAILDMGYTYGNTAVYLNTSCSIIPVVVPTDPPTPTGDGVVCHRDNGNRGSQTLNVGSGAVASHLAHGDTLGACAQ